MYRSAGIKASAEASEKVLQSTISAAWLLGEIADAYPISTPSQCELMQAGSTDRYLISTQHDRFLLRIGPNGGLSFYIDFEMELLRHLNSRGIGVPRPVATRGGSWTSLICAPEGIRGAVLFTCQAGDQFSWHSEESSRVAGRTLAAFHEVSQDFASPHP